MELDARTTLIEELREHALVIGEVVLTSGATAHYLIDAKRAILLRRGFEALAALVAAQAAEWGATAVGGMTMGADPIACAALAGGADVKAFFVRKEVKQHGLSRRIEGPLLEPDQIAACWSRTSSPPAARRSVRSRPSAKRVTSWSACSPICDRLAGGAEKIKQAAGVPYVALTTIDDVYPERPDR